MKAFSLPSYEVTVMKTKWRITTKPRRVIPPVVSFIKGKSLRSRFLKAYGMILSREIIPFNVVARGTGNNKAYDVFSKGEKENR